MNGLTEFFKRHTRHASGVIISTFVFVITPGIIAMDTAWEELAANPSPNWYQRDRRPYTKALIAVGLAVGALRNQSLSERRKKIIDEETAHKNRPLTEEEWAKLETERARAAQTKGQTK